MRHLILSMLIFTTHFAKAEDSVNNIRLPPPEFRSGTIFLTQNGVTPSAKCGSHTAMILDTGNIVGNFAYFQEQMTVSSECEIMIMPNPRMVLIEQVEAADCGSVRYLGQWLGTDAASVTITDHRSRLCADMFANLVTVEFKFFNTDTTQILATNH